MTGTLLGLLGLHLDSTGIHLDSEQSDRSPIGQVGDCKVQQFISLVPPVHCSLLFIIDPIHHCQHLHIPLQAVACRQGGGAV